MYKPSETTKVAQIDSVLYASFHVYLYIRVLSSPASVSLDQHSQPATLHVTGSGIRMTDRLAAAVDAVCNKGISF